MLAIDYHIPTPPSTYKVAPHRTLRMKRCNYAKYPNMAKWNTNFMQHCAGFISAESLYMFRAQAPIIRSI